MRCPIGCPSNGTSSKPGISRWNFTQKTVRPVLLPSGSGIPAPLPQPMRRYLLFSVRIAIQLTYRHYDRDRGASTAAHCQWEVARRSVLRDTAVDLVEANKA